MNRKKIVVRTSLICIIANLMLSACKAFIGILANSVAIVSDAINNLSDALSGIITIIGTHLASKDPDKEHPYGHGRIEYITSLVVSAIVLYAGVTALIESIKKIIEPEVAEYSMVTIVILAIAIIVKLVMGLYVKNTGKQVKSDALIASGIDAFNDAALSISVLLSAVIYIIFHISLEAYVGILVSAFIIKTGIELIKTSIDSMLGVIADSKLFRDIKKEVVKEDGVEGAYDLILNDYGPNKFLGSIHIEVKDTLTVAEIDKISRNITKNIMKKYGVILHTIGVYAINTKDKKVIKVRDRISNIVFSHEGILEMHGFYIDEKEKSISFDIIIDFKIKDRDKIYKSIYKQVKKLYKNYTINITLDVDTSD